MRGYKVIQSVKWNLPEWPPAVGTDYEWNPMYSTTACYQDQGDACLLDAGVRAGILPCSWYPK